VLSSVLLIVGAIAYTTLPVSDIRSVLRPSWSPRNIGASAQPCRHRRRSDRTEINGVEDIAVSLTAGDFERAVDDHGHVQARHDSTRPRCCAEPRRDPSEIARRGERNGVVTRKNSPDIRCRVHAVADDSFDQLYISNYPLLQVRDQLLGLTASAISNCSARADSRCGCGWTRQIPNLGLTSGEVVAAIRGKRTDRGGQIGEPPISDRAFQPNLTFTGG